MEKNFTVTVEAIEGSEDEVGITLPEDFFVRMGWKVGDTVYWKENKDGSWTIFVKDEN